VGEQGLLLAARQPCPDPCAPAGLVGCIAIAAAIGIRLERDLVQERPPLSLMHALPAPRPAIAGS